MISYSETLESLYHQNKMDDKVEAKSPTHLSDKLFKLYEQGVALRDLQHKAKLAEEELKLRQQAAKLLEGLVERLEGFAGRGIRYYDIQSQVSYDYQACSGNDPTPGCLKGLSKILYTELVGMGLKVKVCRSEQGDKYDKWVHWPLRIYW